jgi:hypothetical protein
MTTVEIPTVTTGRLRLRAFRASDLDAYAAMQANPDVIATWSWGAHPRGPRSGERCSCRWALRGYGMWACEKIDGEVFVGSVGIFHPLDWPEAEIAYSLDQPFWGQGLATETARAARDWLFEHSALKRAAQLHSTGQSRVEAGRRTPRCSVRAHFRVAWHPIRILGAQTDDYPDVMTVARITVVPTGADRSEAKWSDLFC